MMVRKMRQLKKILFIESKLEDSQFKNQYKLWAR